MEALLNYPSGCLSTKDQRFYKAGSQHAMLSVGCRDKCRSWIISPQTSGHTLSMLILSACLPCRPELWQLYLLDRDVNRQDSCNYRTASKTISTYQQEGTENWTSTDNRKIHFLDLEFQVAKHLKKNERTARIGWHEQPVMLLKSFHWCLFMKKISVYSPQSLDMTSITTKAGL